MPSRIRRLEVRRGDRCLAYLEQRRWPDIRCRYTAEALHDWPGNSPLLSCSLPLGERPLDALAFCRGLLPEGDALEYMAREAGVSVNDTFALLARYGRDVAGAVTIGPEGEDIANAPPTIERYDADGLAAEVEQMPERPLGLHDDSELSLAGLQNKILLVRLGDGAWARPRHGYPSTHILKADDPRHVGLVDAEAACLRLARELGLSSVAVELVDIADTRCLIVSRFDRRESSGQPAERIHQEDLCQAMGIDPMAARGRAKYQEAGGPSFADAAGLLDAYAADPLSQLGRLVDVMTFTVLIGNADAHGKNLALLHDPLDVVSLASLYDTVPTMLWPKLRRTAAMTVGGVSSLDGIRVSDLIREAVSWSYPAAVASERIRDLLERSLAAVRQDHRHRGVTSLVRTRATAMLADLAAT